MEWVGWAVALRSISACSEWGPRTFLLTFSRIARSKDLLGSQGHSVTYADLATENGGALCGYSYKRDHVHTSISVNITVCSLCQNTS